MSKRTTLILVAGLVMIVGQAWVIRRACFLPDIRSHRGDGSFQNISRRAGPIAMPGYFISFKEFDLSDKYEACYHFSELPEFGLECALYFAIHDPDLTIPYDNERGLENGEIRLELRSSSGAIVRQMRGRPCDFIWTRGSLEMRHLLYQLKCSRFYPDNREHYELKISYLPHPRLAPLKGYAYIQCGGDYYSPPREN